MSEARRLEQRARDAISRQFIQRLTVPNVYFDAPWPTPSNHVDVLAIDRAGSGDAHVVEIKRDAGDAVPALHQLMRIPAHYRWIALFADSRAAINDTSLYEALLPDDGMGRVGVFEILRTENGEMGASVRVRAERFRGSYRKEIASFVAANEADIELDPAEPKPSLDERPGQLPEIDIERRLAESRVLLGSGHPEAALVLAWSAAEAAMRMLADREGLGLSRNSPRALVEALHDLGLLTDLEHRTLSQGLNARNVIVHGFAVGQQGSLPVEALIQLTERILSELVTQPNG